MARNLIAAGFSLVVHSRSPGPVDELVAAGAQRAENPRDVGDRAPLIVTVLPDTPDLEAVVSGRAGLIGSLGTGSLLIDMSTVDPIATRRLGQAVKARGAGYVDAPMSGGQKGAEDATLSIMVGGSEEDVSRARPVLEVLGGTIVHVGDVGAGQVAKAANQLVVGVTIEAVAEAIALAEAAGVDAAKVREAPGGFAASRVLDVHGQRMLDRSVLLPRASITRMPTSCSGWRRNLVFDAGERRRPRSISAAVETGRGDLDHSAWPSLPGGGCRGPERDDRAGRG